MSTASPSQTFLVLDPILSLITPSHVRAALQQSAAPTRRLYSALFEQATLPTVPLSSSQIQLLLHSLALLDTNNFGRNVGVGEREGRVVSPLVTQRHYGLAHGIGRSGDIAADQPKAAGSSLISKLCRGLVRGALRQAGARAVEKTLVVPMCTGMTLALVIRTVQFRQRSEKASARYVVWPRIDQKTSLKCIYTAGFEPSVVPQRLITSGRREGLVMTDLEAVEARIAELGPENVVCVLSTSSCFAPRCPDNVDGVADICSRLGVAHVVNNAFGAQSIGIMNSLDRVLRRNGKDRRLDVIVQSTDKNFRVPVGGAVVASSDPQIVDDVASMYAGRASISPVLDLFITLLGTSQKLYKAELVARRSLLKDYFLPRVTELATSFGERILDSFPKNPISFCMTLDSLTHPRVLGGKLFYRAVSGPRVFEKGTSLTKQIVELEFSDYGSHVDGYPHSYLVMSCAIGMTEEMIDVFLRRLKKAMKECQNEERKARERKEAEQQQQQEEEEEEEEEGENVVE